MSSPAQIKSRKECGRSESRDEFTSSDWKKLSLKAREKLPWSARKELPRNAREGFTRSEREKLSLKARKKRPQIAQEGLPRSDREKPPQIASTEDKICDVLRRGATQRGHLKTLSNEDLLAGLKGLRGFERAVQLDILYHLIEVERRRLYLSMAYSSLFEFCTGHMGYSRSSAGRRIRAARCIDRFPRAAELFHSGELSLCALSMISGILMPENAEEILAQVMGKPLEDVEMIVARHRPGGAIRDRVRPVFVMNPAQSRVTGNELGCINTPSEKNNSNPGSGEQRKDGLTFTPSIGSEKFPNGTVCQDHTRSTPSIGSEKFPNGTGCQDHTRSTPSTGSEKFPKCNQIFTGLPGATEPERVNVEQRFKIEFVVAPEFMKKLDRIKSLLSSKNPKGLGFENIFNILMEEYLDRHSPEARIKKRFQRKEKKRDIKNDKNAPTTKHEKVGHKEGDGKREKTKNAEKKRTTTGRSRHIPQEVKDSVFVRDGGRCTFIGPGGKRCIETRNLQIDHIIPYAKGGSNSPENLRLLCFKHNQLEAEREYGSEFMKKHNRRE